MPQFTVRAILPDDRLGFNHVRSRVYRGGDPVLPEEKTLRDDSYGFVVLAGDQIVGAATALQMTCSHNGSLPRCAGIAAVGVLPEWRGSGAGSALMTGLTPLLRDMGFLVASLHPFRDTWYRRFGYASIGPKYAFDCPTEHLPKVRSSLVVRELPSNQWDQLNPVIRANSLRYNGFNVRTPDQWWRTLGGDSPMTIYAAGDPIEAYCVVKLNADFWVPQDIKEVLWSTSEGHHAMLQLFRQMAFNKTHVTWTEPPDSPTFLNLFDRGSMKVTVIGPVMYRLLAEDDPHAAHEATKAWMGDPNRVYCCDFY